MSVEERNVLRVFDMPKQPMTAPCRFIVHHNPTNDYHPYNVHMQNMQTGGLYGGGYWATRQEADKDFERRVARWIEVHGVLAGVPIEEDVA